MRRTWPYWPGLAYWAFLLATRPAAGQTLLAQSTFLPVTLTGQTAAIAQTPLFFAGYSATLPGYSATSTGQLLPAGNGLFRTSIELQLTTVGTAGTILATVFCQNGFGLIGQSTPAITVTAAVGTEVSGVFVCEATNSLPNNYSTTFTGVTGSPAYALRIRVEYLGP